MSKASKKRKHLSKLKEVDEVDNEDDNENEAHGSGLGEEENGDDNVSSGTSGNNCIPIKERITEARVGMKLEICDEDNIWSSASVVKITRTQNRNKKRKRNGHKSYSSTQPATQLLTIRYHGWSSQWDEDVALENNERLVKAGTYTKRLKCLVDLFPRKSGRSGRNQSTLWPCVVNIRTPSPLIPLDDYLLAEEFLRQEPNIFIQPYGVREKYLSSVVIASLKANNNEDTASSQDTYFDPGRWVNVARIRMWRNDITSIEGKVADNFEMAYNLSLNDDSVSGVLPYSAFEKGSLVNSKYRIKPREYIEEEEPPVQRPQQQITNSENDSSSVATSESITNDANKIDTVKIDPQLLPNPNTDTQLIYHAPAALPPPFTVNTSIYPDSRIIKSTKTGKWIASHQKNGNDIILGSFSTQFEAQRAIKVATTSSHPGTFNLPPTIDTKASKMEDVNNLTLATVVSLLQSQAHEGISNPSGNNSSSASNISSQNQDDGFSLHQWTVQHTKHKGYELEKFRAKFEELKKKRELRAFEKGIRRQSKRKKSTR